MNRQTDAATTKTHLVGFFAVHRWGVYIYTGPGGVLEGDVCVCVCVTIVQ